MNRLISPISSLSFLAGLLAALAAAPLASDPLGDARPRPARHARNVSGDASLAAAQSEGVPFELLAYGSRNDGDFLTADAAADLLYRVPSGRRLVITDLDATATGVALLRKRSSRRETVAFAASTGSHGTGHCARSLVTGIVFEPGDEVLLAPAGSDVHWAALRGRMYGPLDSPVH